MISCHLYDYIEIACLYTYPIQLTLKNAEIINGEAIDTARNTNSEECIKVKVENKNVLIALSSITVLEIKVKNPHFEKVRFT
jgi:Rho-binding antiterminator